MLLFRLRWTISQKAAAGLKGDLFACLLVAVLGPLLGGECSASDRTLIPLYAPERQNGSQYGYFVKASEPGIAWYFPMTLRVVVGDNRPPRIGVQYAGLSGSNGSFFAAITSTCEFFRDQDVLVAEFARLAIPEGAWGSRDEGELAKRETRFVAIQGLNAKAELIYGAGEETIVLDIPLNGPVSLQGPILIAVDLTPIGAQRFAQMLRGELGVAIVVKFETPFEIVAYRRKVLRETRALKLLEQMLFWRYVDGIDGLALKLLLNDSEQDSNPFDLKNLAERIANLIGSPKWHKTDDEYIYGWDTSRFARLLAGNEQFFALPPVTSILPSRQFQSKLDLTNICSKFPDQTIDLDTGNTGCP